MVMSAVASVRTSGVLVTIRPLAWVKAAGFAATAAYVRPVAALTAGLIADRFDATRSIGVAFVLLAIVYAMLSVMTPDVVGTPIIVASIFASLFGVFALRGIYFALLEETQTPPNITGAAVGMVSLVGFTPEIFFAPIAGRILDATPGAGGHLNVFLLLAAVSACGVAVVAWLYWLKRNQLQESPVS